MKPTITYVYPRTPSQTSKRIGTKFENHEIQFVDTNKEQPPEVSKIQEILDSGKAPTVGASQYIER